jgi:hypothetical protein
MLFTHVQVLNGWIRVPVVGSRDDWRLHSPRPGTVTGFAINVPTSIHVHSTCLQDPLVSLLKVSSSMVAVVGSRDDWRLHSPRPGTVTGFAINVPTSIHGHSTCLQDPLVSLLKVASSVVRVAIGQRLALCNQTQISHYSNLIVPWKNVHCTCLQDSLAFSLKRSSVVANGDQAHVRCTCLQDSLVFSLESSRGVARGDQAHVRCTCLQDSLVFSLESSSGVATVDQVWTVIHVRCTCLQDSLVFSLESSSGVAKGYQAWIHPRCT